VRPHRRQPTGLPRPWDSPGKNTGVGCHFLLPPPALKSNSLALAFKDSYESAFWSLSSIVSYTVALMMSWGRSYNYPVFGGLSEPGLGPACWKACPSKWAVGLLGPWEWMQDSRPMPMLFSQHHGQRFIYITLHPHPGWVVQWSGTPSEARLPEYRSDLCCLPDHHTHLIRWWKALNEPDTLVKHLK